jgi:type II secretory pathway pseudopilin PulG
MMSSHAFGRNRPAHRLRSRLDDESGFSLLEVAFAMTLLVLVIGAVSVVMVGALNLTQNDRNRSVAANLASREIDTVRAADFATLTRGTQKSTQTVDNLKYTIKRVSKWIKKNSSGGACDGTSDHKSIAFLSVKVTVTWPNMFGVTPVGSQTILTPPVGIYNPNSGDIAVRVLDSTGAGLDSIPVAISSSVGGDSQTTDEDGCAFFAFLTAGTYTVTLSQPGYVDGQGNSSPSQTASVVAGSTSSVQFDYEQASTLQLTLQGPSGAAVPDSLALTLANTHLLPIGTRVVAGALGAARTVGNLFPYPDGYSAWVGDCADADPGAARAPAFALSPGSVTSGVVLMPGVRITVTRGVLPISGATLVATHATDTMCSTPRTVALGTTDATGSRSVSLPFGKWTISVTGQLPTTAWPSVTLVPPGTSLVTVPVSIR